MGPVSWLLERLRPVRLGQVAQGGGNGSGQLVVGEVEDEQVGQGAEGGNGPGQGVVVEVEAGQVGQGTEVGNGSAQLIGVEAEAGQAG